MGGPEPGTVDMKASCSEQGPVNIMLACSEKSTFEIGPQVTLVDIFVLVFESLLMNVMI